MVRVRLRVRVHPGVAAAAVQGLQLLQLQIQGSIIFVVNSTLLTTARQLVGLFVLTALRLMFGVGSKLLNETLACSLDDKD